MTKFIYCFSRADQPGVEISTISCIFLTGTIFCQGTKNDFSINNMVQLRFSQRPNTCFLKIEESKYGFLFCQ